MQKRKNWDRQELVIAFGLYCHMSFGKMHSRNPDIIKVAKLIDRTPSALAMKLTNIASLDPEIISTGRKGLSGASNADKKMWDEMHENWDDFALESSNALNQLLSVQPADLPDTDNYIGNTRTTNVEVRIGQNFFRKSVLSAYNDTCCISGLSIPKLLVASHIVPWRVDASNRLNPSNGLCLSMLHDKAFDIGMIAIQNDMTVITSKTITSQDSFFKAAIKSYEGKRIAHPDKFQPNLDFLEYHRENIFQP